MAHTDISAGSRLNAMTATGRNGISAEHAPDDAGLGSPWLGMVTRHDGG